MNNIIPLHNIAKLSQAQAAKTFTQPQIYQHLGLTWEETPVLVELKKIQQQDVEINVGREFEHTNQEIDALTWSYAKGFKVWENSLLIVSRNKEPNSKFDFDLRAGFGTAQALIKNNVKHFYVWVVDGTKEQLADLSALENTKDLLTVSFPTGEEGIKHHFKVLSEMGVPFNTVAQIDKKIDEVWPTLNDVIRGRVIKQIQKANKNLKPRQYRTFNDAKVKQWLNETAAVSFSTNGNLDSKRNRIGYCSVNALDPFINSCMQYAKTRQKSYWVAHVKLPSEKTSLKDKRIAHVNKLEQYNSAFAKLGMKESPIEILGFMPQDSENEDKRYLVDVNGKSIK